MPLKVGSIWRRKGTPKNVATTFEIVELRGPDVYFLDQGNYLRGRLRLQVEDFYRIMVPVTSLERFLDGCED